MRTLKVYKPSELKKKFPDGFNSAFEHWKNDETEIPWSDEIIDSLKAVFKASGIQLRNWSIGAYSQGYVNFDMESDVRNLQGQRAIAWLENNLLSDLRIRWTRYPERAKLGQYGFYYRPGKIKPCPFTGVCFDDDFLKSLQKDILEGCTLGDAYHNLADKAVQLFQNEYDYFVSEEYFLEQDHLEFTKEGRLV